MKRRERRSTRPLAPAPVGHWLVGLLLGLALVASGWPGRTAAAQAPEPGTALSWILAQERSPESGQLSESGPVSAQPSESGEQTAPPDEPRPEAGEVQGQGPEHPLQLGELPGPQSAAGLAQLGDRLRACVAPLRIVFAPPAGMTLPLASDRRGWAVWVSSVGGPRLLAPLALLAGGASLRLDLPGSEACRLQVEASDEGLGLAQLSVVTTAGSCRLPAGWGTAGLPLHLPPSTMPGAQPGAALAPASSGVPSLLPTLLHALPQPGDPVVLPQPVSLLGGASGAEAFYLLHDAPWALSGPLIDAGGRLVGLACGPSLLQPRAGLAIGPGAIAEFLAGRRVEGVRPYRPSGQGPSWPPSSH